MSLPVLLKWLTKSELRRALMISGIYTIGYRKKKMQVYGCVSYLECDVQRKLPVMHHDPKR
jgi:hypothetical protein